MPPRRRGIVRYGLFGLEVESRLPIEASPVRSATGGHRRVTLKEVAAAALAELWPSRDAPTIVDRRTPRGRRVMSIESHPRLGYRIATPGHGRYVVSRDGTRIRAELPPSPGWRWQRLLFAQALPLAAALHGFALFHASAVAIGGRAVAFVAASGRGKSSVAAHMIASGATFVTDDVLALEPVRSAVYAHPGPRLAGIDASELRALESSGRARLGDVVGRSGKTYLSVPTVERALPLAALYFLERTEESHPIRIVDSGPPDPRLLLSSSFMGYLTEAPFLLEHLDVCSRLAQAVRMARVLIPSSAGAAAVASVLGEHALGDR